jgi:hypothetical protein
VGGTADGTRRARGVLDDVAVGSGSACVSSLLGRGLALCVLGAPGVRNPLKKLTIGDPAGRSLSAAGQGCGGCGLAPTTLDRSASKSSASKLSGFPGVSSCSTSSSSCPGGGIS